MKRFLFFWMVLVSLGGCAVVGSRSGDGVLVQIDDIATGAPQTHAAIVEVNGKPALLYANQNNRIVFQYGDQRRLLDETARVQGGNRYQLHVVDQKLLALWWSHQDGKNLYSTVSENQGKEFAPVSIVNEAHGVLPPPRLLRGPQGVLGVTYLDERQLGYQLYFNRSTDLGRTWPSTDQRLDTPPGEGQAGRVQEPQAVESGSVWITAWADSERVAGSVGYRILGRRSEDAGLHWSEPAVIYRPQKFVSSFSMRAIGNQIVLIGDERGRGIFAVTSKDQGLHWSSSEFVEGSEYSVEADGASNSGIDVALAGERAHLVWMQDRPGAKTKIMRASLDIARNKWLSAAQRLDTRAYENTRAMVPSILATAQGTIWAAWVDYQDIRPNIYISTSTNQGQTWAAPKAFFKPGELTVGWPRLLPWGNGVALAYEAYPTERELNGKFILRTITLGEDGTVQPSFAGQPGMGEADRKLRLEQRIKSLWEKRIAGDYDSAYDIFDFAYKAATPKKSYVESVGVITYQTFAIEDTSINGNEANVKMKIKYEVKQTTLPSGKPIKLAPLEVESTNTWVWVANDWYLVYNPSFGQPILKY